MLKLWVPWSLRMDGSAKHIVLFGYPECLRHYGISFVVTCLRSSSCICVPQAVLLTIRIEESHNLKCLYGNVIIPTDFKLPLFDGVLDLPLSSAECVKCLACSGDTGLRLLMRASS